ncbi:hypothetical protein AB6A40_009599 [Gnathostoma spinigerum]|uniref:Uncharacterized protein n=1 Tax=Gnathostoma spinigerum TaxID=75299 RepID=A0ABD6F1U8_9BILA
MFLSAVVLFTVFTTLLSVWRIRMIAILNSEVTINDRSVRYELMPEGDLQTVISVIVLLSLMPDSNGSFKTITPQVCIKNPENSLINRSQTIAIVYLVHGSTRTTASYPNRANPRLGCHRMAVEQIDELCFDVGIVESDFIRICYGRNVSLC